MAEPLVYLNGRMVPASRARLAIYDAGVVLGATVTELVRTVRKRLYQLDEHLDRLFRSLRYARLDLRIRRRELAAAARRLAAHNSLPLADGDDLALVLFVTAGELPAYAGGRPACTDPTVCAHTFPLPFEDWADQVLHGAHLVTPSVRQVPPQCYDPKVKYRSRLHYYLAEKEARLVDPEASALLLDLAGNVTETSRANLLVVERGTLVSPTTANTLPGISRANVIRLAGELGIPFVERDLQVYNVMNADEALLSSTSFCLMPVTKVNGVPVGNGKPGPVYRKLLAAWGKAINLDIEQQILEGARRRSKAGPAPAPTEGPALESPACEATAAVRHILDQLPQRAADRSLLVRDGAAVAALALWSLLHWERQTGLKALEAMHVDLPALTRELDRLLDRSKDAGTETPLPVDAKDQPAPGGEDIDVLVQPLLERAAEEARALGHGRVDTEHLLLAILADTGPELAALLKRFCTSPARVKETLADFSRE